MCQNDTAAQWRTDGLLTNPETGELTVQDEL